jgi:hypothetical protein
LVQIRLKKYIFANEWGGDEHDQLEDAEHQAHFGRAHPFELGLFNQLGLQKTVKK